MGLDPNQQLIITSQSLQLFRNESVRKKYFLNFLFKDPFTAENRKIIVPNESEQAYIHKKIVEELENGLVNEDTKQKFLQIITSNGYSGMEFKK